MKDAIQRVEPESAATVDTREEILTAKEVAHTTHRAESIPLALLPPYPFPLSIPALPTISFPFPGRKSRSAEPIQNLVVVVPATTRGKSPVNKAR